LTDKCNNQYTLKQIDEILQITDENDFQGIIQTFRVLFICGYSLEFCKYKNTN